MQRFKAILGFAVLGSQLIAQVTINAGTSVIIEDGTTLNILTDQQSLNINSNGDLENNGQIFLGENVWIVEASGPPIHGTGTESISKTINGPLLNEDPGGLGCEMSTSTSINSISVIRGHTAYQNDQSEWSVERWYQVTPSVNGGLDLSLRFHYDEVELNGIVEGDLEIHRSSNNGTNWQAFISSADAGNDHVDALSIDSLALFTLFPSGINAVIEKPNTTSDIFIFPVPSAGEITISNISRIGQIEMVVIVDQLGRSQNVNSWKPLGNDVIMIDTSFLSSAVYDLLILGKDGIAKGKMVIQK